MTRRAHLGLSTRANSRFLRFLCSIKNLFYLDLNIDTKTLVVKSWCRDPAASQMILSAAPELVIPPRCSCLPARLRRIALWVYNLAHRGEGVLKLHVAGEDLLQAVLGLCHVKSEKQQLQQDLLQNARPVPPTVIVSSPKCFWRFCVTLTALTYSLHLPPSDHLCCCGGHGYLGPQARTLRITSISVR